MQNEVDVEEESEISNLIIRYSRLKSKSIRYLIIIFLLIITGSVFLIGAYYCWLKWLPEVWNWGFTPTSWKCFFSVWAAFFLLFIPLVSFTFFSSTITGVYATIIADSEQEFNDALRDVENKQKDYLDKIEGHDKEGLISLITYSKIELEQYYKIGLNQTQKSYNYSIVSMWIGFLIIMFGIICYIIPMPNINPNLITGNFQELIIGSGIVIEIISALFLWIYKNSVNQLRYFYNRQIFIHNALFAYKISDSMNAPDAAKHIIIEKILDFGLVKN